MGLKFVNLHGHDGHSVYDAIGTPEEYSDWMLKNAGEDSGALAITNHGNMNSIGAMVAAQKKYDKKGAPVKLIYGCEAYFIPSLSEWTTTKQKRDEEKKEEKKKKTSDDADTDLVVENEKESKGKYFDPIGRRNHLVLVAQNQEGLKNLFRLVSRSYREGFFKKPRIDLEMLRKFNSGIIASTACLAGVPSWCSLQSSDSAEAMSLYERELTPLMEIFGKDRFFLELQFNKIPEQQIVNQHLIQYSKHSGYSLIATADCHYPDPQMFKDREIYRLLGYQMQKRDIDLSILEKKRDDLECELYLKNGDQMLAAYRESFKQHCDDEKLIIEAIERTYDIAHHAIDKVEPDAQIKLPKTFQVTESIKTPFDKLKDFVLKALKEKKLTSKEYLERAAFELKVIQKIKTEEYFLAMKEILDVLKQHMLIGPGRGSGAGSLVNYLLGITLLDPIKHGLLFERFLSPSRAELPDVDSDVESKDEAFEILKNHFGADSVLAISNYNRLTLKALIKDLSKLYSIPFQEVNAVTKVAEIEARVSILSDCGNDQKLYDFTFEGAKKYSPTFNAFLQKYPHLSESVENLFKEVKAVGRHAGGVLVVPDAESCLPIIRIRDTDQSPITEGITAQHLKYFGLVKFDVLGLGTLRIIRKCIETILKNNDEEPSIENVWKFYNAFLHPDVIDPNDIKVFNKVYNAGKFPSTFQFEKQKVQNFCTRATPWSVRDLSAITSIWRPGPLCLSGDSDILTNISNWEDKRAITSCKLSKLYDYFNENKSTYILSYNQTDGSVVRNKIINIHKAGKKKVFGLKVKVNLRHHSRSEFDSANFVPNKHERILKSSEDHRFLTTSGWKTMKELQIGDYVYFLRTYRIKDDNRAHTRKNGNVRGRKTFRDIAFENYEYRCIFCDWLEASLDVNHIDGNRNINNAAENLCFLCPNHHKMYSEKKISKEEILTQRAKFKLPLKGKEFRLALVIGKEEFEEEETYDIEMAAPHHNFIAGGFVVHNSGGAHEKYINFDENAVSNEHQIIKEILGPTRGLLIYQEQFMLLAAHLAGFTLEEADKLRKLLVKPATSDAEQIRKERKEIGDKFVVSCVERGVSEERATRLWEEEILGFISYGFNKSHAMAYAYNSYHCAWLYTYYEQEWIKACLECDPELEKTIATTRILGYTINKVDVNSSSVDEWNCQDTAWSPPLTSLKGVGTAGANELLLARPTKGFENIYDFFFDALGKWRWSKLNSKIVKILIQAEAFNSIGCVGPDKLFKNYKHMYDFINDNWDKLKANKIRLDEAANLVIEDWSAAEKITFQRELMGFYDKGLILGKYAKLFREFDITAIDEYGKDMIEEGEEEFKGNLIRVWGIVEEVTEKKTVNGKPYLTVKVTGMTEKPYYFRIWAMSKSKTDVWEVGNVVTFSLDFDEQYGYSLSRKTKVLRVTK